MADKQDYRKLIHTPSESATEYVAYADGLSKSKGLTWGVKSLDEAMIPLHPGDVCGIIARPGHGKSSLAAFLARKTAKDILAREADTKECVVYVTFEQSTEEIEAFFQIDQGQYSVTDFAWGKVDLDVIRRGAVRRVGLPVWLMGKSMARRGSLPRMTVENVYRGLETIEHDYKIKPVLIVLDYIQIVPVDRAQDRVNQVSEAINRSKTDLAMNVGCPVVICVQADRGVDKYASKVPTSSDCQWSSAIEQASDKLFGIWRPALTQDEGSSVRVNGTEIAVTDSLLIAKLLKQRFAAAGKLFALHFAPEYIKLADLELRSMNP